MDEKAKKRFAAIQRNHETHVNKYSVELTIRERTNCSVCFLLEVVAELQEKEEDRSAEIEYDSMLEAAVNEIHKLYTEWDTGERNHHEALHLIDDLAYPFSEEAVEAAIAAEERKVEGN